MPRALIAFEPPDGGVAEHVLQLALGLPAHGWSTEVAGPGEATVYPRLEAAGVPVHRIALRRGFSRPWRDARALRELGALMRSGRFDIVHCHAAKAGAIGRPLARMAGIPVVYTPHCFGFVGDVGAFRRVAVAAAERLLGRITDRLVCVCDVELRVAETHHIGDPSRRVRVYNAAEPCDRDQPSAAALSSWRRRGPVVGTIAVFRRQKRIDVFLDAAPRVLREVPDCSLAVIGDGPLRGELQARADDLGLSEEPRFAFLPFEPPSAPYLRELDLFVLPSSWEAFPMSLLEALACGVPQVATDVGGTREAVSEETAILVPPDSADRLADATIELLREPVRRAEMAAASTARYRQLFRVERMVAETADVYASVAGPEAFHAAPKIGRPSSGRTQ